MTDRRSEIEHKHVLYLLHFGQKVGRAQHYLGITTPEKLERRLRAHSQAHGARLTTRAAEAAVPIYLVKVWPVAGYDDERRAKRNGHFNKLCSICRGVTTEPRPRLLPTLPTYTLQPGQRPIVQFAKGKHP